MSSKRRASWTPRNCCWREQSPWKGNTEKKAKEQKVKGQRVIQSIERGLLRRTLGNHTEAAGAKQDV